MFERRIFKVEIPPFFKKKPIVRTVCGAFGANVTLAKGDEKTNEDDRARFLRAATREANDIKSLRRLAARA